MKRILITGKNSYIGKSLEDWLLKSRNDYSINSIDMKNDSWKNTDFSQYDVVFHVAGIAHVSVNPKLEELYYKVNRDLTIETAKKAKADGVKQFIFMSSMIVYGDSTNKNRVIDNKTVPKPSNFYGKSKLQAEEGLLQLESDSFKIVILRPPMIYGKNSKGNYPRLAMLARKTPIFPNINNQRSMLHVDNLTELIRLIIKNNDSGIFYPQNKEYIKTSELVRLISHYHEKKVYFTKAFNIFITPLINKSIYLNKLFGSIVYDQKISEYKEEYRIRNLAESIKYTEKRVVKDE